MVRSRGHPDPPVGNEGHPVLIQEMPLELASIVVMHILKWSRALQTNGTRISPLADIFRERHHFCTHFAPH
jgi:hypothetical protein